MASEISKILRAQADAVDAASGTEKALALLALGSFLTSRALLLLTDVQGRDGLDDQQVLDLAREHDRQAADAWSALKAATEPAG